MKRNIILGIIATILLLSGQIAPAKSIPLEDKKKPALTRKPFYW